MLKNACTSAGMVLPSCQDTGTAIVHGTKGQFVLTDGSDAEALSRGVFDTYTSTNLRYSQLAPKGMFEEANTGSNLPAQIDIAAGTDDTYKFMFVAKGGGSANKTFLFQGTPALMRPGKLEAFLDEKIKTLGTAACPPYHLAVVIGGLSAEQNLKTLKLATCRYLDNLPGAGLDGGYAYRDRDFETVVHQMTRASGIGAQFGGKYFCHDVRVIRLPRHSASVPIGIGVSCSADRQALAKITADGVFLEKMETDPARFLPEVTEGELDNQAVRIDLNQPMSRDPRHPVAIPDQDPAQPFRHPDRRPRHRPCPLCRAPGEGAEAARLCAQPHDLLCRPREAAGGLCLGLLRADHRGADGFLPGPADAQRRQLRHPGQGQPVAGGADRLQGAWRLLPRLDRRCRRDPGGALHQEGGDLGLSGTGDGGSLERSMSRIFPPLS